MTGHQVHRVDRRLTDEQRRTVDANKGLVYAIVGRTYGDDEHMFRDMTQAGMLGLMRAVQLYDPARGCTLATYADDHIRAAIQRARQYDRMIHVPAYMQTRNRVGRHEGAAARALSVSRFGDHPDEDMPSPPSVVESPGDAIDAEDAAEAVRLAVAALPDREREIVMERMTGKTLLDIGRPMGITRERVRQIEREAHRRLKDLLAGWEDAA